MTDNERFFREMLSLYYAHRTYNIRYYASLGLTPLLRIPRADPGAA